MTAYSHCLPEGELAPDELPVPNFPGSGSVQTPASPKGVAVLCHGLQDGPVSAIGDPVDTGGALPLYFGTWASDLLADDWVVVFPSYAEDGYSLNHGHPCLGLYQDVATDPGEGYRYLQTTLRWWDHAVEWRDYFHPGLPLAIFGASEGGWHALTVASQRPEEIIGAIGHIPATIWSNVDPAFTTPADFDTISTVGMDLGPHALDDCDKPVMVSYGTSDVAVGWGIAGQGTCPPSYTLPPSNTDLMIVHAQAAGQPVTRNATTDNHELLAADVTTFMDYIKATIDPLR